MVKRPVKVRLTGTKGTVIDGETGCGHVRTSTFLKPRADSSPGQIRAWRALADLRCYVPCPKPNSLGTGTLAIGINALNVLQLALVSVVVD